MYLLVEFLDLFKYFNFQVTKYEIFFLHLRNTKPADKKSTGKILEIQKLVMMRHAWSLMLFLLALIHVGSKAYVCTGKWEREEEGREMVVRGSFSTRPPQPFIIDFHNFAQLGKALQFQIPEVSATDFLNFILLRTWLRGQRLHQGGCSSFQN